MKADKAQLAINAAIDLFGQQGIDNTSTQAIAKHANIGNATLFKYFESKDTLIREAYLSAKMNFVAYIKKDVVPTDKFEKLLRMIWNNFLSWSKENPRIYNFVQQIKSSRFKDPEIEAKVQHEFLFFTMALNAAKASGEVVDEPLELIQATIVLFLDLAVEVSNDDSSISEQQVYQLMLNSLKINATT